MKQLFILFVAIEWDDGNAIVNVEGERVYGIVDDDYLREVVLIWVYDSQVFDIVAAWC